MTTPRVTVPPQALEAIAFNLCSLHDFDVAFVRENERFATAVITEYARALSAAPAPEGGAVSIWSDARNVFVRYAELFAMTERYEEASAIADKAAREIEALATREEAPAEAGEISDDMLVEVIHRALGGDGWAYSNYGHDERRYRRDEMIAAGRAVLALRAQPQAREEAQPVAGARLARAMWGVDLVPAANPAPDALRDAERYRYLRSRDPGPDGALPPAGLFIGRVPDNVILTEGDADAAIDQALAALQAEQKGGAA